MKFKFYIEDIAAVQTLIPEPIGWSEAAFTFFRDADLHGIFPMYNNSLKFYGLGYDLIASEYAANGVEGFLRLIIQFECGDEVYEELHTSKLNFSKIEFENSAVCLVLLPIEDDNCLTLLKNRQDVKVELSDDLTMDGDLALVHYSACPFDLSLEPKTIVKTDRFGYADETLIDGEAVTSNYAFALTGVQVFTSYLWVKQTDVIDEIRGFADGYVEGATDIQANTGSFYEVPFLPGTSGVPGMEFGLEVNYSARLEIDVLLGNGTVAGCAIGDGFSDATATLILRQRPFSGPDTHYTIGTASFSGCYNTSGNHFIEELSFAYSGLFSGLLEDVSGLPLILQSTDLLSLYLKVEVSGDYTQTVPTISQNVFATTTEHGDTFIKITVPTTYPATNAEVVLVNEALSRAVEKMTGDCLRVKSDYFGRTDSEPYVSAGDGYGSMEVLTKGTKIRRALINDLLFSFKDMYDGLNAIHSLGMGLEPDLIRGGSNQWVRIERAQYFYDDVVVLVCDKVPDIKIRVISEEHYSIFDFGYSKWEGESFNGLDEFATRRQYRTSLKNVKNTLTKQSNLIASGYAIELTRQQHAFTSKDWRYDNDGFIVCVERDSGYGGGYGYGGDNPYIVEQGNITSPANLIDPPTVYNFRISPVRNLLRWAWKIFASYNDPFIRELIFMSGEGNIIAEGKMDNGAEVWEANVLSESEPQIVLKEDIPNNGDVSTFAFPEDGMPIYRLEEWQFEYPMSVQDYHAVKANPRGLVQVRYGQNTTFTDCYIRRIEYKPVKGLATFTLLPFVCRQARATIVMLVVPSNGDTFTISFPETADEAAWSVTFTFQNTPVLPNDIHTFPGDVVTTGVVFNHAIRGYLIDGGTPVPDGLRILYSDLGSGGDGVTQRFFATPKQPYDGQAGNDIELSWSNAAIFDVSSPVMLDGGTGSCNVSLLFDFDMRDFDSTDFADNN